MKSSTYYFHMKTKILANIQICINVPLKKDHNFNIQNICSLLTSYLNIYQCLYFYKNQKYRSLEKEKKNSVILFQKFLIFVTWKLPSGKLPPGWFPPDNSHPENSHQRKFPTTITPTRTIPTRKSSTLAENFCPANCNPG